MTRMGPITTLLRQLPNQSYPLLTTLSISIVHIYLILQIILHNVVVENYILNIKTNAMGIDGITLKMLQICIPFLTPAVTFIVNKCIFFFLILFNVGLFPLPRPITDAWRRATPNQEILPNLFP